jgi:methylglutaconyl-CoA hydratase
MSVLQHASTFAFKSFRNHDHRTHHHLKILLSNHSRRIFSLSDSTREVMLHVDHPLPRPGSGTSAEQQSGVAVITLNRPKAANALGFMLMQQLREILNYLNENIDQSRQRCCIIRSSSEKVFSAGADLRERKSMEMTEVVQCVDTLRQTFEDISRLPIPTLSVIEGAAFGGGLELALATDIRIASTGASFGLVETSLAIIPGAGGTQRLPRLIGAARAKELIFTARRFNAEKALELGIVQYTTESGNAMLKAFS